jgi:hypothetical protein
MKKPTIAEALAAKLGRDPTHAELCSEVKRILQEASADLKAAAEKRQ